jgi:hypothetical protein
MAHVFKVVVQWLKVLVVIFKVVQGFKIWGWCAIIEGFFLRFMV